MAPGRQPSISGSSTALPDPTASSALCVAHPGHELRIHEWVCRSQPLVFILTDGSGGSGEPRTGYSAGILRDSGGRAGSIFGQLSDRDAYAAILGQRHATFVNMVRELADGLVAARVGLLVCDAAEGYNPVHDVCRAISGAAVRLAANESGHAVRLQEFPLVAAPDQPGASSRIQLDDAAFARKLAAATRYAPLAAELGAAVDAHGRDAFRTESLVDADPDADLVPPTDPPFYETYGQRQVENGLYDRVLRYRDHMRPLLSAIRAAGLVKAAR